MTKLLYQAGPYPVSFLYSRKVTKYHGFNEEFNFTHKKYHLSHFFFPISELKSTTTIVIPPPPRIIHSQTEQQLSLPQLPVIAQNSFNCENYTFPS